MAEEAIPSSSKKNLLLFAAAVLVAVGASVGGTLYFVGAGADESAEPAAPAPVTAVYHNLRPAFIVNYVTGGKPRYLQADLTVMARDPEAVKTLVNHMPLVRSRILGYLTDLDFYELQTSEGKQAMRDGLRQLIDEVLQQQAGVGGIESVLLNNFVMQ
jgi:flagellar FliL protein